MYKVNVQVANSNTDIHVTMSCMSKLTKKQARDGKKGSTSRN